MFRFLQRPSFLTGIFIGVFSAVIVRISQIPNSGPPEPRVFDTSKYQKWFERTKLGRRPVPFDVLRYGNNSFHLESQYLRERIAILCVILVKTPRNADAVRATWGRSCNQLQFLNLTTERKKMPSIVKNRQESSWVSLCELLKTVPGQFGWVLVVYDYTFVLVENLRLFLGGLEPLDKHYLGHAVQFWSTVYNMGQAGYVLSQGAVRSFKQKFNDKSSCTKVLTYRNQEDYYLGKSLLSLNITPVDTRDSNGLSTFHPYNLHHVFFPEEKHKLSVFPHRCCSPHTVAFQSIEGDKMYTYYYLLYTLQVFHYGELGNRAPPKTTEDDQIWKTFLKERDISEHISPEQYYKIWENIVDDPTSFARHMKREEYFDYN
ncbi:glycoprotein-N-acetylgalactosamine 3-beta-galactosyltransferase 1 [Tribolium castaneum]|uniref:Glycoprotein-N-acetylgalactosamine 3-beta-galactosyltransferase 1-B-like Protein n=1 Tax=Tribolium castaneum TaxID=7070 RepID=D6X359_TRICA|nr:PREDICTED: glycoprotein-N-acetylgalactosamine 3-beta-galactosyltransferase 1 [Tribolium castaneum]EFA10332.1 Glycoprotein-N-acetylgalactosamine 3-beta-galactosyltransferase 1-B-like Protein [Tribolium castaneum]|eukprot:XP_001811535.1 PREDICTED: glycoprotein-N-acetylgalactosamine 3-beta-galactosyltransferase 1 [Tribolium castaneum]